MIQIALQFLLPVIVEAGVIPGSIGAPAAGKSAAESPKGTFADVGVLETR